MYLDMIPINGEILLRDGDGIFVVDVMNGKTLLMKEMPVKSALELYIKHDVLQEVSGHA